MEFDYQNPFINPSEINITGDELNHSVLLDSTSKAGAREFNYSTKNSDSNIAS